jgi:hypothetical protein
MIDAFTGFVMLKACKSLEAKHVVSALAEMFGRFGGPYEIYVDNHPSFLAKDLEAITRRMVPIDGIRIHTLLNHMAK